ncbi:unnamed protein product [Nesidiocoris tenuis]|uniref:Protein YIF1 n=1 Tax=Nesidiocoris tenuis TaxID=355587 RepID=A0A6H5HMB3_9HEMI|nr:unnamed protein product [Nesidiocoris tenuis]CAB0017854.1 unnamed protein product [Nesidiocoris tenuis]
MNYPPNPNQQHRPAYGVRNPQDPIMMTPQDDQDQRYGYPGPSPGQIPMNQFPYMPNPEQLFNNPMVADVAMHYGNKLMDTGKEMVDKELNKYVSVSRLKHYFAVDTGYVVKKLKLVVFPFTHGDWARKFDSGGPAQPRDDVNSPDLYIPLMAYVTYLLVAGLALGTQDRFKPDILAICATQALAWIIIEIGLQLASIYIFNVQTNLNSFELLSFAGYKFVGIISCILLSIVFQRKGYYACLLYFSIAIVFFLIRALKYQVMCTYEPNSGYSAGASSITSSKRKMYILLSIAITQPFFIWWLSYDFNSPLSN